MRSLRILFALFVLSVLVSQSVMDLFSTLVCLQWIWLVVKSRKESSEPKTGRLKLLRPFGLEWIWGAWFVIILMGFLLNPLDPQYALVRLIELKWIFILYVLIEALDVIKPSRQALNFLLFVIGLTAAVNAFLFLADIPALDEMRYGSGPGGFIRAGGFFANPMTFAHSFVLFVSVLLGLVLFDWKSWSSKQKSLALSILVLSVIGLFWTYTRGVWLGFLFSTSAFFLFWKPKYFIGYVAGLGLIFALLFQTSEDFRTRVLRSEAELMGHSERKLLWQTHFAIWRDHPWFGAGYGQNTKMLPEYYRKLGIPETTIQSHAHNELLHLGAGTGLLGLLCYLVVWGFFYLKLWQLWNKKLDSWDQGLVFGMGLAQTTFLIAGLTEANFEHSKVRFAVLLIWAYLIYLCRKYQIPQSFRRSRR